MSDTHGTGNRKTVMICDDEVDLLNMYKTALERTYDVIVVDSGEQCIERYVAEKKLGTKIHVLLLDYKLGDMLGDIVACKIKELNGVKTLLVSAYDLDEKMTQDLIAKRCIVGTVKKPLRLPLLLRQVEEVLNGPN